MFDKNTFDKINKKSASIAPTYFKSFGAALINLEKQVVEKSPDLAPQIKDIISNINKYRKSGELENKLKHFVKSVRIAENIKNQINSIL